MALSLSKDYTFAPNTTIASAEVNQDFDELYNAFSGLEAGTSSMSKLPLDADPTSALYAATKQYVDIYATYRRPVLSYVSSTQMDVENNTSTANQTKILFPDGNLRSVTEDTASTHKYRRFDITATAEFTAGTEDAGLYTGLAEATNTWYAIYAVKSLINTANFVLVGTTTLPLRANVATLNTNLGTNGWVYLGLIRNGDNSGATGDILTFVQHGNKTLFRNVCAGSAVSSTGTRLANTAGATSITYTYAAGTGATDIPGNVLMAQLIGTAGAVAGSFEIANSAGTIAYVESLGNTTNLSAYQVLIAATGGCRVAGANTTHDIFLTGLVDNVLGVGSNSQI